MEISFCSEPTDDACRMSLEREFQKEKQVFIFVLRKKGSKTKERMKEEEIEKAIAGRQPEKSFFGFVGVEPSGT